MSRYSIRNFCPVCCAPSVYVGGGCCGGCHHMTAALRRWVEAEENPYIMYPDDVARLCRRLADIARGES